MRIPRVESTNTLKLGDLHEAREKAVGELRLADKTNAGGLERAEGDIGEELGDGSRAEVDGSAVLARILDADHIDEGLLEELVSTELESALEGITEGGWAEAGEEGTSTFLGNDLAESGDHTLLDLHDERGGKGWHIMEGVCDEGKRPCVESN